MAFPVFEQVLDSHTEPNNTDHVVNINFTTRNDGDLMIVITVYDGEAEITWPAGWTAITNGSGLDGTGDQRSEARYRFVDGTETASITLTSTSDVWASFAFRITGHAASVAPQCAAATGSSGNADPPNLTPSWGDKQTLWIAYCGVADGDAVISAVPSGYTSRGADAAGSATGGMAHGLASFEQFGSSQDPGAFTNSSFGWRALTIGIEPAVSEVPGIKFNRPNLRPRITAPGIAR